MKTGRSTRQVGGERLAALLLPTLFTVAAGLLAIQAASAAPFIPDADSVVVERLPAASNRTAKSLRGLRALLAGAPNQIDLALRVAHDEIELGRAEGDPRYYGRAEAALTPWLNLPDPPTTILLLRATLRQNRHDFPAALADLDRVIAAEPVNAQAILVRATVLQVMGEYARAASDCRLLEPLASESVARICTATIDSLTGHGDAAYAALAAACAALAEDNQPALLLWGLTILGETAERLGKADEAETAYRRALALGIRDVYLLGAYADFLLDHNRPAEVVSMLENETRIDPLLLRLALAKQRLAAPDLDRFVADLAERFDSSRRRGDTVHRREEARFTLALLNDPRRALDLALANWAVQKEPWDSRLVVETALAAHAPEQARAVREWLATSHLQDEAILRQIGKLDAS